MLKVKEYDNFDAFEKDEERQEENIITIVHSGKRIVADAFITCKRVTTAVKRFMKMLECDERFNEWDLLKLVQNGTWKDKEIVDGKYIGGWFYEVTPVNDDVVYVCLGVVVDD